MNIKSSHAFITYPLYVIAIVMFTLIVVSVNLSPSVKASTISPYAAFTSAVTTSNDLSERYVIFLGGINSFSSEDKPLNDDFKIIKEELEKLGYKRFIYFSYSAVHYGKTFCRGWGTDNCDNSNNLVDLSDSPVYSKDDTHQSIIAQVEVLDWLIEQVVKRARSEGLSAKIDLIGFSLGGVVTSYWAAKKGKESSNYSNIHSIVLINSPVGGVPLAGPILQGCKLWEISCIIWSKILAVGIPADTIGWTPFFGSTVLRELQLPVDGISYDESIVDSLPDAARNFPEKLTSIQSKTDYLVNDNPFPICQSILCFPQNAHYVPVGRGTQFWVNARHTLYFDEELGGVLVTTPVYNVQAQGPLLENHNSTLKNQRTAQLIIKALLVDRNEHIPSPNPDGTMCGQLKWATPCDSRLISQQYYLFQPCQSSLTYLWQPLSRGFSPDDYDRHFRIVDPVFETLEPLQCTNEHGYVTAKLISQSEPIPVGSCGICESVVTPPATPAPAPISTPSSTGELAYVKVDWGDPDKAYQRIGDIWLATPDGLQQQLTHDGNTSHPVWSPDGNRLVYEHHGDQSTDLYLLNLKTGDSSQLVPNAYGAAWSPDGQSIAFVSNSEIYTMKANGGQVTLLSNRLGNGIGDLTWSPDGRTIGFTEVIGTGIFRYMTFIDAASGNDSEELNYPFEQWEWATFEEATMPRWSPNGREIAFVGISGAVHCLGGECASGESYREDIYIMSVDGSRGRLLVENASTPSWSPDGSNIAFLRTSGQDSEIWIINVDGSGVRKVGAGTAPAWRPIETLQPSAGRVCHEGICLSYPPSLSTHVIAVTVPYFKAEDPNGPWWENTPKHVRFEFKGYPDKNDYWDPVVMVYPLDEYLAYTPTMAGEIELLQQFLLQKPDIKRRDPEYPLKLETILPNLIRVNAGPFVDLKPEYIDFNTTFGIRYITQFAQDLIPITLDQLVYIFQGFTDDKKYYVEAVFPVSAAIALDTPPSSDHDQLMEYNRTVAEKLEQTPDSQYVPVLNVLDDVISSLSLNQDLPVSLPDAWVNTTNLNLRTGPGTNYVVVGTYPHGTAISVLGKNSRGDWLRVEGSGHKQGWMATQYLQVNIDLARVPLVEESLIVIPLPTKPPVQPIPQPVPALSNLRDQILSRMHSSDISNPYPHEAERFADALLAHLDDFRLPQMGITRDMMIAALQKDDVGDRINALVNNVWKSWGTREGAYTADTNGLSPFRQLVVRLIQSRQGTLTDPQKRALHTFFTRSEDSRVWLGNIDGVIGAVNRESFQTGQPTPQPMPALSNLRDQILLRMQSSVISNPYSREAERFADALLAHLGDFRLPQMGITQDTMIAALQRDDVGDRINALVNNVWKSWGTREGAYTADTNGLSPFRQLVVRLIQARQGTLTASQQHAIHNLFTRSEDISVWRDNVNSVIGAVNRESFQWQ